MEEKKIVILDALTVIDDDIDLSVFEKYGQVKIYPMTEYSQIKERIKDANIILCNKSLMDAKNLSAATALEYIGLFATGYNNIELEYTSKHNITVCNAGAYSTDAVAQHVFALMLYRFGKIGQYDRFVKEGKWIKSNLFSPFMSGMTEISGKTIGIIGYGSIGKKVADIAKAFGMKVVAYNRSKKSDEGVEFVSLDKLLAESDVVTVHCPLNQESAGMCNDKFFEKMKETAMFINTSRGGVVDELALYNALETESIAEAALDVIEQEPMKEDCILMKAKNITITPHAAWAPLETRQRLIKIVENNLKSYIEGNPINVVK